MRLSTPAKVICWLLVTGAHYRFRAFTNSIFSAGKSLASIALIVKSSHAQPSVNVVQASRKGVWAKGRWNDEKRGSCKGQGEELDAMTEQPEGSADVDERSSGGLKEKVEEGNWMEKGKSKKLPSDRDLMAFVLDICPPPAK